MEGFVPWAFASALCLAYGEWFMYKFIDDLSLLAC